MLLEQAARLIANFDLEIFRDALSQGGAHAADVIAVAWSGDVDIAQNDRSVTRPGRGGQREIEGIAEADAAVENIERATPAETRTDAKPAIIAVDARSFEIGELAARRPVSANIMAAVLSEQLSGDDALKRFETQLDFGRVSARRAPRIHDKQDGG